MQKHIYCLISKYFHSVAIHRHLSGTGQTDLPATLFANLPKLVTVTASGNQLTGLDPTIFANNPLMNRLYA